MILIEGIKRIFNSGDNKGMSPKQRFVDYACITMFVWTLYLIWLLPFQFLFNHFTYEQLWNWLVYGTALEFVFTYPIAKTVVVVAPKITKWASGI